MKNLLMATTLIMSSCAVAPAVAQELPPPYISIVRNFVHCETRDQIINEFVNINAPPAAGCTGQTQPIQVFIEPKEWVEIENEVGAARILIGTATPASGPARWVTIKMEEIEGEML